MLSQYFTRGLRVSYSLRGNDKVIETHEASGRVQSVVTFCQAFRNSPPLAPAGAVSELVTR
jgi:hypothetical protein